MTAPPFEPAPPEGDVDEAPPPEAAWIGRTLGDRYLLEEILGSGGMAVVFRAKDTQLERSVALKVLRDEVAAQDVLRARFEREAKVLASLSHPHIVSLIDYGVTEARPFLVMELLAGQTLGDLFHESGPLPPERAFGLVRQIVAALSYAHGEGLLHRDLKPDNVFLQSMPGIDDDHVKLLDFGFAKLVGGREEGGAQLTQAGTVFGTPRYMAPEQLTGRGVDARADLYAVAVILYEALSGRRPFEGGIREVLQAKVAHDPPPLSEVAPELSAHPELEAFFARALATATDERYPDAKDFMSALAAIPQPAVREGRIEPGASDPAPPSPAAGSPSDGASAIAPAGSPPSDRAAGAAGSASTAPWWAPRSIPPIALAVGGGVALLAVLGIAVAIFGGSDDAAAASTPPATPAAAEDPWVEEPSLLPIDDPWTTAYGLAPAVVEARQLVLEDLPIDAEALRALRDHATGHPDDPYAQLVLGHAYADRDMRAMSVTAYQRALRADPATRGDPRMIVDLVRMVADGGRGDGPARLVRAHYGADALGVVDAALEQDGLDRAAHRRLTELRADLE